MRVVPASSRGGFTAAKPTKQAARTGARPAFSEPQYYSTGHRAVAHRTIC